VTQKIRWSNENDVQRPENLKKNEEENTRRGLETELLTPGKNWGRMKKQVRSSA